MSILATYPALEYRFSGLARMGVQDGSRATAQPCAVGASSPECRDAWSPQTFAVGVSSSDREAPSAEAMSEDDLTSAEW